MVTILENMALRVEKEKWIFVDSFMMNRVVTDLFLIIFFVLSFSDSYARELKRIKLNAGIAFHTQVDCRLQGETNAVYEISSVFDIEGKEVEMPAGCTLLFNGGRIKNGKLVGNNSKIESTAVQIFENIEFKGLWDNDVAYPEWYGAIGNGVEDDTKELYEAVCSPISKRLLLKKTYLVCNSTPRVVKTGLMIIEGGRIVCTGAGLHINGNNLTIKDIVINGNAKSKAQRLNYSHAGLSISGNNNTIENVEVYNIGSCGIRVGGKNITVRKVRSHDNHMGLVVTNSARNVQIIGSWFENNNVVSWSGADGILFQRTASDVIVEDCHIINNGEHGVYFQGQNAVFRNNVICGNKLDGLKFGSYDDGGYVYQGEKIDLWVKGTKGVPGYNNEVNMPGYGVSNVLIEKNYIKNNGGGDAIFFQPSAKGVQIRDNIIENNDITCSFFNYTGDKRRLEDINHILVENNKLTGVSAKDGKSCRIYISATSDVEIRSNTCGRIGVYAPNKTTAPCNSPYLQNCVISNNECGMISINRSKGGVVQNNKMESFSSNTNCSGLIIVDNEITNQEMPIVFNVISEFCNNQMTVTGGLLCYETKKYKPKAPGRFHNNTIIAKKGVKDFIRFCGPTGKASTFQGNTITCVNSGRPISIISELPFSFNDNIVIGKKNNKDYLILLSGSGIDSYNNSSNGRIGIVRGKENR